MIIGDEEWIVYNNVEWKIKWITVNHLKSWFESKEYDAVYLVVLEDIVYYLYKVSISSPKSDIELKSI